MTAGAVPLAFVAGVLSILSPCVLPILPIVLGAAASEHRWGPAVLAAGLSVSFVTIGLFAATIGYSIGLDGGIFRDAAAVLMIAIGAILLVPRFQAQLARLARRLRIGAAGTSAPRNRAAFPVNCSWGCCLVRFGALASARRWERLRSWQRKGAISRRLASRCSLLAWERRSRCSRLVCTPDSLFCAGAVRCFRRAMA
jgi:cytochrome c biogenesis protein CcdA